MTNSNKLVKIYANSLYKFSEEELIKDVLFDQIIFVEETLNQNVDVVNLLKIPTISKVKKKELVDEIYSGRVIEYIVNFIKVLIDNDRISLIIDILNRYKNIYYKNNNIEKVIITTAINLSNDEKADVIFKCEKLLNKKVIAQYMVNDEIIGGIIIKTDDKLYDMSVKAKLNSIKKDILKIVI